MFDRDWNDFLGYMVYNTPGSGLCPYDYDESNDEDTDDDDDETSPYYM